MADQEEQLFQRDAQHFRQNAAWNFSAYLCIWSPNFFMRLPFGGFQKECLRLGYLLDLADEHFRLPAEVMVPLLFPGLFVGDAFSGVYFLFEGHFFSAQHLLACRSPSTSTAWSRFLNVLNTSARLHALHHLHCIFRAHLGFNTSEVHFAWVLPNPSR